MYAGGGAQKPPSVTAVSWSLRCHGLAVGCFDACSKCCSMIFEGFFHGVSWCFP